MRAIRGFTLVEIMIVVAVIGVLAALAIPSFMRAREKTWTGICICNLKELNGAVDQWKQAGNAGEPAVDDLCGQESDKFIKHTPVCPKVDQIYNIGTSGPECLSGDTSHTWMQGVTTPTAVITL